MRVHPSVKLGQPVPLSYLVVDEKSGCAQPAQTKVPAPCSSLSGLEKGRSVFSSKSTPYTSAGNNCRHSDNGFCNAIVSALSRPRSTTTASGARLQAASTTGTVVNANRCLRNLLRCIVSSLLCSSRAFIRVRSTHPPPLGILLHRYYNRITQLLINY